MSRCLLCLLAQKLHFFMVHTLQQYIRHFALSDVNYYAQYRDKKGLPSAFHRQQALYIFVYLLWGRFISCR